MKTVGQRLLELHQEKLEEEERQRRTAEELRIVAELKLLNDLWSRIEGFLTAEERSIFKFEPVPTKHLVEAGFWVHYDDVEATIRPYMEDGVQVTGYPSNGKTFYVNKGDSLVDPLIQALYWSMTVEQRNRLLADKVD